MMMDAREGQTALPVASMLMVQIPVCFAIESMFPTRSYTLDGAHFWGAPYPQGPAETLQGLHRLIELQALAIFQKDRLRRLPLPCKFRASRLGRAMVSWG